MQLRSPTGCAIVDEGNALGKDTSASFALKGHPSNFLQESNEIIRVYP